jgi:diacylglycerol kinase
MKKFLRGFVYAFNGLKYAANSQLNFRVHIGLTVFAIGMGLFLRISAAEWCWISLCIGLVLVIELMNTALEILTDLVTPEYNEKAGHLKDISAGAVLVAAIFALVVGLIIFLPKLLAFLPYVA